MKVEIVQSPLRNAAKFNIEAKWLRSCASTSLLKTFLMSQQLNSAKSLTLKFY